MFHVKHINRKVKKILDIIECENEGIYSILRIPGTLLEFVIAYNDTDGKYVDDFTYYIIDTDNLLYQEITP